MTLAVADPGLSGGANSQSVCANLLFCNFLPKTARKWKNLNLSGARIPGDPLDPPMACLPQIISRNTNPALASNGQDFIMKKHLKYFHTEKVRARVIGSRQ